MSTNRGMFPRVYKASGLNESFTIHLVVNAEVDLAMNLIYTTLILVINSLFNTVTNFTNN